MGSRYFVREIEPRLRRAVREFPAVLVTGPRQSGKTTLCRRTLTGYGYVTLDDPGLRALANSDPRLFLATHPAPLVIDEIQYAPGLLPYLKIRIDDARRRMGRYVLTGSQIFPLMAGVSESLAGRIAVLELPPLSWKEILAAGPKRSDPRRDDRAVARRIVDGFYPEAVVARRFDAPTWYSSYINTYLERDVRNLRRVTDLGRFQTFVGLLAARAGGLLNLAEVGRECGVAQPTARDWLTVLEATGIVRLLGPYHTNLVKRIVKAPKLYFLDTGLLCHLLGIDSGARLFKAAEGGRVFENMVILERIKRALARGGRTEFYYYRTGAGVEVDLVVRSGGALYGYEIKFAKTVNRRMAAGLAALSEEKNFRSGTVLSLQEETLPLAKNLSAEHWSADPKEGVRLSR